MKEVKSPKKPLAFYYFVVLIVLFLFNFLLMPLISRTTVKQVDYGTFMQMTKDRQIGQVEIEDNQILFTDKDGKNIYKTGIMDDPGRTERLYESGAVFSSEIVHEMSPVLSILLSWVLPVVLFIALGQMLSKKMMDKMGGGGNSTTAGGKAENCDVLTAREKLTEAIDAYFEK